jgi:hypothetical protein
LKYQPIRYGAEKKILNFENEIEMEAGLKIARSVCANRFRTTLNLAIERRQRAKFTLRDLVFIVRDRYR